MQSFGRSPPESAPPAVPGASARRHQQRQHHAFGHPGYLWSPSKNNLQYAYMDELGQEAEDEEEEVDMSDSQTLKGP